MVENNVDDRVIGIAFDGTGYGTDGNIWGAEFMICDYKNFIREGHLNYVHIPSGDGAIREPWKMAVSYMYSTYKNELYNHLPHSLIDKNIKPLISMIKNNINSPLCSSMGRLFDAVSALLGYKDKITFEGEAAILLESMADINENKSYNYYIDHIEENYIIDTTKLRPSELKDELMNIYVEGNESDNLIISIVSFGFKHGVPLDADLVFDVRFLPNPFYLEELKNFTGNDTRVREYVMNSPVSVEFSNKLNDMINFLIPHYIKEGKNQLVIAIGCTGGMHRSVTIAHILHNYLKEKGYRVLMNHRDSSLSLGRKG